MLYTTSGGEDVLVASTEHRGSWLLSTDVKYFISSVSCLISLRRAAFCFSRSSLSCEGEGLALKINVKAGPKVAEGVAGAVQIRLVSSSQGAGHQGPCVHMCVLVCAVWLHLHRHVHSGAVVRIHTRLNHKKLLTCSCLHLQEWPFLMVPTNRGVCVNEHMCECVGVGSFVHVCT